MPAKRRSTKAKSEASSDEGVGAATASAAKRKVRPANERSQIPAGKRRRAGDVLCGRCGASSSKTDFYMVPGSTGEVPSTACMRCYIPYYKCWAAEYEWPDLCAKCKDDATLQDVFEQTCKAQEGVMKHFPEQAVVGSVVTGYRLVHNMAFVHEHDFKSAFGTDLAASAINKRYDHLTDYTGSVMRGVLVQHPQKPWMDVEVFTETHCRLDTHHLPTSSSLRAGQGGGTP